MATVATTATPPEPEARGVCVSVLPSEKPVRLYADSPGDFIETLGRSSLSWVNFAVDDLRKDGVAVASLLGFSGGLIEALLAGPYTSYEDRVTEMGIRLPVVKIEGSKIHVHALIVLAREELVLSLHEHGKVTRMHRFARYADVFMRKIPNDLSQPDKITTILTRIMSQNNDRNFEALREIQEIGDSIGAELAGQSTTAQRMTLGRRIYEMKHTLVAYLDSLWATLDVVQSLRYGDAELISDGPTYLSRIEILGENLNRQIQLTEHMSEVLVSGLEVLQSIYNNELQSLNNRLALVIAWLTIVGTAILVPNTIATMFGPILDYEGAALQYYILFMALATFVATAATFMFVRRSRLWPAGPNGRRPS